MSPLVAGFTKAQFRTPLLLAMLVILPLLFVSVAASVLADFSTALGGGLSRPVAVTLTAGWVAAFIGGSIGFFQTASSRDADRRLVLAGMSRLRVVAARLTAGVAGAVVASLVAVGALALQQTIAHPLHVILAVLAFAIVYVGLGAGIGLLLRGELEGSLLLAFVFLMDMFSGKGLNPGASGGVAILLNPTRKPAELLIDAGLGNWANGSVGWQTGLTVVVALAVAALAFTRSMRRRGT